MILSILVQPTDRPTSSVIIARAFDTNLQIKLL